MLTRHTLVSDCGCARTRYHKSFTRLRSGIRYYDPYERDGMAWVVCAPSERSRIADFASKGGIVSRTSASRILIVYLFQAD